MKATDGEEKAGEAFLLNEKHNIYFVINSVGSSWQLHWLYSVSKMLSMMPFQGMKFGNIQQIVVCNGFMPKESSRKAFILFPRRKPNLPLIHR